MNINATLDKHLVTVRHCEPGGMVALQKIFPGISAEPAGTTLVAFESDQPVGLVQVRWTGSIHNFVRAHIPSTPEIRRLRVHAAFRGKGISKLLLKAAEDLVAAEGFRSVSLVVGLENKVAISLYDASGWKRAELPTFRSRLGLDDEGRRYTHVVQCMQKTITQGARSLVVA